jgi:hypothetical protein
MNQRRYYASIILVYLIFVSILLVSGYFSIGLLSDDYNNLNDAVNTSIVQKFSGDLPFTNKLHLRPLYYLSMQIGYYIHNSLGLGYDNFINFRIGNLILFLILAFMCGQLVYNLCQNYFSSIITVCSVLFFPSNIHNICWLAGRVDILCGIFFITYLYYSIKYIKNSKNAFLIMSTLFFLLALLTKETAIIALPICLIFIYFFNTNIEKRKLNTLFFSQLLVLIVYFSFKCLINQFHIPYLSPQNNLIVIIKSFLGFVLPIDPLSIQYQLHKNDISILIYFVAFIFLSFFLFLYLFQTKFFKIIFFTFLVSLISTLPYSITGYVRPQLMLIPFSATAIFIISASTDFRNTFTGSGPGTGKDSFSNVKNYRFIKPLVFSCVIVLLFWTYYTYNNINQWKYAFYYSRTNLDNLLSKEYDSNKYTIILGNPGRIDQFFMFDKITGAYNYWKYKTPVIIDTIYDIVLTGTVAKEDIITKIQLNKLKDNEFEIYTKNENLFFYIEGFDINKNSYTFENNKIKIEFSEFSYLRKPMKMKIILKSKDINCFMVSESNYYKIY